MLGARLVPELPAPGIRVEPARRAGSKMTVVPFPIRRGTSTAGFIVHEESDVAMIERNYLFPGVIEMNYQARRRMGVNVYLIDGGTEYALIDVGFLDELTDVLELIRQMDFSLSACKLILATPRRRRPHPGSGPGPRDPQVPGRRPPPERRSRSSRATRS